MKSEDLEKLLNMLPKLPAYLILDDDEYAAFTGSNPYVGYCSTKVTTYTYSRGTIQILSRYQHEIENRAQELFAEKMEEERRKAAEPYRPNWYWYDEYPVGGVKK